MDRLAATIFRLLRRMDAEATTTRRGYPSGLNWYGVHYRPELKQARTEPSWTQRLWLEVKRAWKASWARGA